MNIYEKLYSEFQKKLLSPRWLNKVQLSRDFIDNILKSKCFKDNLKIMVSKKDFSCKSTLWHSFFRIKRYSSEYR